MILYQLICDYGVGDPAFAEVVQRFKHLDPDGQANIISVPAFSTIATGFWIAQLALRNPIDNVVIFSNTAPRHDDHQPRNGNEGEKFVFLKLENGATIGVVNAGYALSFVKEHIQEFHKIQTSENGSQFRSRDFYPEALVKTLTGQLSLGEALNPESIPDYPHDRIAFIDGYGNIKTTLRRSDLSLNLNSPVTIKINDIAHSGVYTDGIFSVNSGELTVAPGSSGDPQDPFLEIFRRRGTLTDPSASDIFNQPPVESQISISTS